MNPNNFWEFISRNFISLSTVILGVFVITLSQINIIPQNTVQVVILALLCLLATSEIVESRRSLSKIEEKLNDISMQLSNVIGGIKVTSLKSPDDVLNYMIKRTKEARFSIDQSSLDYQRGRTSPIRQQYEKTRDAAILSDRIKYRYISVLYSKNRLDRSYEYFHKKKLCNYYIGFYPPPQTEIPLFNFVIFDKEEVLLRYPFSSGQDPEYVLIQSPIVVKLFSGYFEKLLENSYKVENDSNFRDLLTNFKINDIQ